MRSLMHDGEREGNEWPQRCRSCWLDLCPLWTCGTGVKYAGSTTHWVQSRERRVGFTWMIVRHWDCFSAVNGSLTPWAASSFSRSVRPVPLYMSSTNIVSKRYTSYSWCVMSPCTGHAVPHVPNIGPSFLLVCLRAHTMTIPDSLLCCSHFIVA